MLEKPQKLGEREETEVPEAADGEALLPAGRRCPLAWRVARPACAAVAAMAEAEHHRDVDAAAAARAVERADAEALDRSAAQLAAARLAERDAARRRKLAAALAAERDATAAGEGTGASSTGKKKRTRKGRRGVERAHLLVSFGDDGDEDASLAPS